MICVSLKDKGLEEIYGILDDPHVEMAEVRLDLCPLSDEDLEELSESAEKPVIFTLPLEGTSVFKAKKGDEAEINNPYPAEAAAKLGWEEIGRRLSRAIEAGADYVDLPLDAPAPLSQKIQKLCRENGTRLIRSYHDFDSVPDTEILTQIVLRAFRYGADIAKVACKVNSEAEARQLINLYRQLNIAPDKLLLIPMGEAGREARVEILKQGAPFSFAYYDEPTAVGQMDYEEMYHKVYGDWLGVHKSDFEAPCSKSFAQRTIITAALAEGTSHLTNYTPCGDSQSAIEVAKALGAKIHRQKDKLIVEGIGPAKPGSLNISELNVGESGLLARLCIPLMAVLSNTETAIHGKETLLHRPLNDANDIMASFGVLLKNESSHSDNKCYIPLHIEGQIIPGNAEIPGSAGSQLISGLLMALPLCKAGTIHLKVNDPKSLPYMFLTLDVLKAFGIKIACELEGDAEMLNAQDWNYCDAIDFTIKGAQKLKAADIDLESDWSAAACFLTYGALFGEARIQNINMQSTQADISILDVLSDAGAAISFLDDEVSVKRGPMHNFQYDLNNAPDIIPLTCLVAAFCPGESVIFGADRLRTKESDRAEAILQTLLKMGVEMHIQGDEIHVNGMSLSQRMLTGKLLKGGKYSSFHDHRMVMLLSIAQMGADSPIEIDDRECIAKSFPDFFERMEL